MQKTLSWFKHQYQLKNTECKTYSNTWPKNNFTTRCQIRIIQLFGRTNFPFSFSVQSVQNESPVYTSEQSPQSQPPQMHRRCSRRAMKPSKPLTHVLNWWFPGGRSVENLLPGPQQSIMTEQLTGHYVIAKQQSSPFSSRTTATRQVVKSHTFFLFSSITTNRLVERMLEIFKALF